MSKRITIEELQTYLWNSAVLLRTNIDAGAYKQYIFPLLFFKRICDVYDEECQRIMDEYADEEALEFEENHRFQVPKGAHWNDVRSISENVGVAIVEAFRKVENANIEKLQGIFGDGAWTNKNRLPDRLLKELIEHFSSKTLSIENCPEDELGQGYEYLIKKFADDSGHTAQEFYTNRTVVHLMTEMLKPESGESIYDPTCGSGRFMIAHSDEAQSKFKQFWTPTTFNYVNVDLDHNSYIYTALNAVLRNLYSINIHGNSLTLKIYGAIITAPNTSGLSNWNSNVNLDKIKKILEEPLERNMKKKKTENVNMTLF